MTDDLAIQLVARWQAGDQRAADELWRSFADRLIGLARTRLSARLNQRLDPEDVVQSAWRSFFVGAREGRYELQRGGDLWRLLVAITLHKLQDQVKRHTTEKRGIEAEQALGNEAALLGVHPRLLTRDPSPVEAATLIDEVQDAMRRLQPHERRMLELRLDGHTLEEIAEETQLSRWTVRRVLERVKQDLEQRHSTVS
jgi:RNA polymerase sigma factor (sigma-70 family)